MKSYDSIHLVFIEIFTLHTGVNTKLPHLTWISFFGIALVVNCEGVVFAQQVKLEPDTAKVRLAPSLRNERFVTDVILRVSDSASVLKWTRQHPQLSVARISTNTYTLSGLTGNFYRELLSINGIEFIDRANRKAREETVLGDFDQSVNGVTTVQAIFPELNGEGLNVSIKEKPFDQQDLDVRGRIVLNDQFDEPPTLHATFMATIAAGGGNTSPFAKGAAWASGLTTADFEQLLPENGNVLTALNVSVQNHSYGVGLENYYGIESNEYDLQGITFPKILHVFSSGNEGGATPTEGSYAGVAGFANLTGQFKVSKNTVSAGSADQYGNITALSSRGPAHDGRIKPELIAFGGAGSSEAAAIVSGISVLIQQAYYNEYNEIPDAALIKAALINSAQDVGRPHVDFETGFGNADAIGAVRAIKNGRFFIGSVNESEEVSFTLPISAEKNQLKITVVWADPPADPFVSKALINDLDVSVRHVPTNEIWDPWVLNSSPSVNALQEVAQRGKDRVNNVEQITIENPAGGDYEIRITGHSIPEGPQPFFIVYETLSGFEWRYPLEKDPLRSNTANIIRWRWHNPATVGLLEYKFTSESTWRNIEPSLDLSKHYYEWMAPDTSARIQFRITTNEGVFESSTIVLSHPERLKVGFDCADEVMLLWNKISTADQYTLYSLGEKYLEPILTTSDTFAVVQKTTVETNYFSVAPLFSGQEGSRELTIDYTQQGTGCYFISFIPREYLVTGDAIFDITLGTTYKLQSAVLERFNGDFFETVATLMPLPGPSFSITDGTSLPGTNTYRIKLTTVDEVSILSDEVEIFYVREEDMYVFPNPIVEGEPVNIIINDTRTVLIQILDLYGRVIREAEDFGPVKNIYAESLASGAYLVRVQRQDGKVGVRRLIVIK